MLDGLLYVSFRQQHGFSQSAAGGEFRSDGGSKRAARAVRVQRFHLIAAEREHFRAVEKNVHGLIHVAALHDDRAGAALDELARRCFHSRQILDFDAAEQGGFGNVRRDHVRALQ